MASSYRVGHGLTCLQKLLISLSSHLSTDDENEVYILQRIRALFLDSYGLSMYNPNQAWKSDDYESSDGSPYDDYSADSEDLESDADEKDSGEKSNDIESGIISEIPETNPRPKKRPRAFEEPILSQITNSFEKCPVDQGESSRMLLSTPGPENTLNPITTLHSIEASDEADSLGKCIHPIQELIAFDDNHKGVHAPNHPDDSHPAESVQTSQYQPDELHYMKIVENTHNQLDDVEEELLDGGCVVVSQNDEFGKGFHSIIRFEINMQTASNCQPYRIASNEHQQYNTIKSTNCDSEKNPTIPSNSSIQSTPHSQYSHSVAPTDDNEGTLRGIPQVNIADSFHTSDNIHSKPNRFDDGHSSKHEPLDDCGLCSVHPGEEHESKGECGVSDGLSNGDEELTIDSFFANMSDADGDDGGGFFGDTETKDAEEDKQ